LSRAGNTTDTLTRGSGHAVALPAEPADAGLAVGRGVEELEVEGLHGLLPGLALLARGGGAGGQASHDRLDAGQQRHVGESRVPHARCVRCGKESKAP